MGKGKNRPAPLVVKSLETGDVVKVYERGRLPRPLTSRQRSLIRRLRRELGIEIAAMPETVDGGKRVIEALLARKLGREPGSAVSRQRREVYRPVADGFAEACALARAASPESWSVIHEPGMAWRAR